MDLVEAFVEGTIVAVFVLTLLEWMRHRGAQRRDIALALAPLAMLVLVGMDPDPPAWWRPVTLGLFLAMPILFLRLASHLRRIGIGPYAVATATLLAALLDVLLGGPYGMVFFVAAATAPYVFAAAILLWATRTRHGVGRLRLRWTAINGLTFALLLMALVVGAAMDSFWAQGLQVGLAASYVLAFATPRFVRESWRAVEFRRFVEVARGAVDERLPDRMEAIRSAAAGIVEAETAYVLEQRGDGVVCIAQDRPLPDEPGLADRLVAAGRDGVEQVGDWAVMGLHAPGQPGRALAILLRRDRLFPSEDADTLRSLAAEIDGQFQEAAYQDALAAARAAAEELARFRSDYLRAVGHEVANPLTPIRIQTALLRRRHGPESGEVLDRIDRSVERISAIARDVSTVAHLSTPSFCLEAAPTDLAGLVLDACDAYAPLAESAGCRIEVDATGPGPTVASVDPTRVRQILDNLLSNAIKYSPGGGPVRVRLGRLAGALSIDVRDQGLGLDDQQRAGLFRTYGRVHTERAPEIHGTGMGLYIARQLARLHGGDLGVQSDGPGKGSCFRLTLPPTDPVVAVTEAPPLPTPGPRAQA